jgi:predicted nucleic acid-binding protein
LSHGERYAIALAILQKEPLVIDDRLGRQVARALGVSVVGTVGVLIQAKKAGLILEVRSLMQEMRSAGYWLSDELIERAANQAGEGV